MMRSRQVVISLITTAVFTAILFVAAGRVTYWQAWVYAGLSIASGLGSRLVLAGDPDLAKERARPGEAAQAWDKALLGGGLILNLVMLVIAGLDSGRFHWAPRAPFASFVIGMVLSVAGMAIFLGAMKENRFFSAVVRVQRDRGQTVCHTGPYRIVRHPGNAGMIVGTIGLPFLFMSFWSGVPAIVAVVLMIVRTGWEDALLDKELEGYREYRRSTRSRLIPGIW